MVEGVPPELVMADGRWNVGRFIGDELVERFGFSEDAEYGGVYRRIMDSQHAVSVRMGGWDCLPGGGTPIPLPDFGVSRRDINELWHDLLNPRVKKWVDTVSGSLHFFGRPQDSFNYKDTPQTVREWTDEWIPRLIDEVPHLSFVEAQMALKAKHEYQSTRNSVQVPRMMTALMAGWTEAAEAEFMTPLLVQLGETWDTDLDRSMRQGKIDRVRAWISEHPDGIERELTDT